MFNVRNVSFVPFANKMPILFSGIEVLHKYINGVELLLRLESSNLDLCHIFGLISQARCMLKLHNLAWSQFNKPYLPFGLLLWGHAYKSTSVD